MSIKVEIEGRLCEVAGLSDLIDHPDELDGLFDGPPSPLFRAPVQTARPLSNDDLLRSMECLRDSL